MGNYHHDFLLSAGGDRNDPRAKCSVCDTAWDVHPDGPIDKALRRLRFKSFEDFLVSRTGRTLVEMAEELGVSEQRFIVYHSRWVDEHVPKGSK